MCHVRPGEPVLAAVSGGVDSVALCDLLKRADVPFAVAHVNYGLRGEESEEDERFVSRMAEAFDVPLYVERCAPGVFPPGKSVQEEARNTRYAFLERTAEQQGFVHIAVAHHFDDSVETALLNFARGTGIAGLKGISPQHGNIIRPLLFATRAEIEAYAKEHHLAWREDSSNATDNYARNRFRHHLLPWLMSEIPQGYGGFAASFEKLSETSELLGAALNSWEGNCCTREGETVRIAMNKLSGFARPELFLRAFLRRHGFTDAQLGQLEQVTSGRTGTKLVSATHTLIRERDALYLLPHETEQFSPGDFFELKLEKFTGEIPRGPWTALVDADSISASPVARTWRHGDSMVPLGMSGRRNVSDILNELKLPQHVKAHAVVVESGGQIIWVPGYRIGETFKVHEGTTRVYRLNFDPKSYAGHF